MFAFYKGNSKRAITAARFEVVFMDMWIAKVPVKGGRHLILTSTA
jgi:hypothetical protein